MFGATFLGVLPTLLLVFFVARGDHEQIFGMSSLLFGSLLVIAGFLAYGIDVTLRRARPLQ
jgi:hypothetical protein